MDGLDLRRVFHQIIRLLAYKIRVLAMQQRRIKPIVFLMHSVDNFYSFLTLKAFIMKRFYHSRCNTNTAYIHHKKPFYDVFITLSFIVCSLFFGMAAQAAPSSKLIKFWDKHDESNTQTIDHSQWQTLLDKYLMTTDSSGINLVKYKELKKESYQSLSDYIQYLQSLDPRTYALNTQKAYWINLYNALTVKLIIDHYPVKSITKIGKSFFSFGPWDDEIIKIQGQALTLNDIEHGILRPIWKDNRIHYAVNCASIGCPNINAKAYTAENVDALMTEAAKDFVNHSRGVTVENGELLVSSIYDWYLEDFGGNFASLKDHLLIYADNDLKTELKTFKGDSYKHDYNWNLNTL